MGASLSKMELEKLDVFKNTSSDTINIPEKPENRRPTDRTFLIAFIVTVILLFPFLIYCIVMGDLHRNKGYDQCGNVCGKINSRYSQWSCTGQDYTNRPLLQFNDMENPPDELWLQPRKCVENCESGYTQYAYYCLGNKRTYSGSRYSKGLAENTWKIVLACFLSLGVAIILQILFKTATAAVIWVSLVGVIIFGSVAIGLMWYGLMEVFKSTWNEEDIEFLFYTAIALSIFWLILLCVMVFWYKKIKLVIQLLKESTKALFAMPLLIFVPIITIFAELIIIALFIFTTLYIYTSGSLTELSSDYLYYKKNDFFVIFTLTFNSIVAFWAIQFVIGIQYMVIAGAVAKWYWSKDKNNLDRPITGSASIVFKFHLGSIACGSLAITFIAVIKTLILALTSNRRIRFCISFCLGSIESFVKFLSKNSYILTAMHGKSFYKSGKRAAKIIYQNIVNISLINFIGGFVLGMAQLLIVCISLLILFLLEGGVFDPNQAVAYIIVLSFSLFIANACFSIYETIIDTIFLCYCEDSLLNDGMARPYAMSRDLMEFVEKSKKIYGEKNISEHS